MRIGLPYRTSNTVVEYEDGRLIAWRHFGRPRWRYEFADDNNQTAILKSLVRLKALVESGSHLPS